jgi:Uncharacterized protein conserved in bacteria
MTWDDVLALAQRLPGVEESTSYGTPAIKVRGRLLARLRTESDGGLVVMCGLDEKAALLSSGDPAFRTTPHYDGHGSIIVELDLVDPDQLTELITEAWRARAPKRLVAQHEQS